MNINKELLGKDILATLAILFILTYLTLSPWFSVVTIVIYLSYATIKLSQQPFYNQLVNLFLITLLLLLFQQVCLVTFRTDKAWSLFIFMQIVSFSCLSSLVFASFNRFILLILTKLNPSH